MVANDVRVLASQALSAMMGKRGCNTVVLTTRPGETPEAKPASARFTRWVAPLPHAHVARSPAGGLTANHRAVLANVCFTFSAGTN